MAAGVERDFPGLEERAIAVEHALSTERSAMAAEKEKAMEPLLEL